jgi:predicted nucleic acid-binding protein
MKKAIHVYILDTSAIIAFIENEEGADTIEELLNQVDSENATILVSFMTFMEVYYTSLKKSGKEKARQRLDQMDSLPILRVDSTEAMGIIASKIKAKYRLSVADAWIAALAKQRNAILVHKDPEFEQIESEIQVLKLPYKAKS